jgi:hypothetical protein
MSIQTVHRACGHVILGLSMFAMLLVVGCTVLVLLGKLDPAPGGDEGTPAHLFQLAIALLFPAGAAFLGTADWQRPLAVARRLVVPAAALVVAFSTLYYMEHLR